MTVSAKRRFSALRLACPFRPPSVLLGADPSNPKPTSPRSCPLILVGLCRSHVAHHRDEVRWPHQSQETNSRLSSLPKAQELAPVRRRRWDCDDNPVHLPRTHRDCLIRSPCPSVTVIATGVMVHDRESRRGLRALSSEVSRNDEARSPRFFFAAVGGCTGVLPKYTQGWNVTINYPQNPLRACDATRCYAAASAPGSGDLWFLASSNINPLLDVVRGMMKDPELFKGDQETPSPQLTASFSLYPLLIPNPRF